MDTAGGILCEARERSAHNIGAVVLLQDNTLAMKLLAAWPVAAQRVKPGSPFEVCPDDLPHEDRLRWVWSAVEPEPEPIWAEAAGLPDAPHVRRFMRVLQDNALVFPDGKLSKWAEKFIVESARRLGVREDDPPPQAVTG